MLRAAGHGVAAVASPLVTAVSLSTVSRMEASVPRPVPEKTVFLLCDIQERFRPLIYEFASMTASAETLVRCAGVLGSPVVVTEQYPKALGNTVPELQALWTSAGEGAPAPAASARVFEKTLFSMITPEVDAHLASLGVSTAVLFGAEAHVCVLNTVMDLIRRGMHVYVVLDAISSQRKFDRTVAIERFKQVGAFVTTVESIMFELMQDKNHPRFREVSALAKGRGEAPALLSHL